MMEILEEMQVLEEMMVVTITTTTAAAAAAPTTAAVALNFKLPPNPQFLLPQLEPVLRYRVWVPDPVCSD